MDMLKTVGKPRGGVRFVKETLGLRTTEGQNSRAHTVCAKDKSEDWVRILFAYQSTTVFKAATATKRALYQP